MLRTNKGFTLVELMVVIVIIGILAALAIPRFTTASDKAKWSEVPTVMASYENAQLARLAETGTLGDVTELVFEAPAENASKWFTYSQSAVGTYQGVVTGETSIGGISQGQGISTAVDGTDSHITHASVGAADANVNRMCGNFLTPAAN